MTVRSHEPTVLDKFNGLWDKGDEEACPLDHSPECENVISIGQKNFGTRFGVDVSQDILVPLTDVVRAYNFPTQSENTLLVLTYDGTIGRIYHVVNSTTVYGPILSIAGMEDFAFHPYAGRAYISPFANFIAGEINYQKGLEGEFIYVYKGDGTAARKAASDGLPVGVLTVGNGIAGFTDAGFHIFAVVGETDTGYLSPPVGHATFTTGALLSVSFSNIPVFTGAHWVRRHLVATKVVTNYNGNTRGYTIYYIPLATLEDNTTTSLANISFFDQDLLESASELEDNYEEIPAVAWLNSYHNRLIGGATFDDINLTLVSLEGEPEAFNQISGFVIMPPDDNPVTNGQEFRDILYLTKRNRTVSFVDNGDVPSTWPMTILDQALGSSVHGIATVIDSGGTSIDFLIVATFLGICIFNGRYIVPELSWKIDNLWQNQDRNAFRYIQMVNDPIKKRLYISLPDRRLLIGDYSNGMDPKSIKWWPQSFDFEINTIALVNINDLIIGAQSNYTP